MDIPSSPPEPYWMKTHRVNNVLDTYMFHALTEARAYPAWR